MKFMITAKCASGHTAHLSVDFPGREWADEIARLLGVGKCNICEASLEVTVREPLDEN